MSRVIAPSRLHRIAREAAERHNLPLRCILFAGRSREGYKARAEVIRELHLAGFSPARIGKALGRDRSTIEYWLRKLGL